MYYQKKKQISKLKTKKKCEIQLEDGGQQGKYG